MAAPSARPSPSAEIGLRRAKRALTLFTKALFSGPEPPGPWVYDFRGGGTLRVTGNVPIPFKNNEARPAVVVEVKNARFANIAPIGRHTPRLPGSPRSFGRYQHRDLVASNATISCLSRDAAEATLLAEAIARNLPIFAPQIQRLGKIFKVGADVQVGDPTPPGSLAQVTGDYTITLVPVVVPIYLYISAIVEPETDSGFHGRLQHITMTLESGLRDRPAPGRQRDEPLQPVSVPGTTFRTAALEPDGEAP